MSCNTKPSAPNTLFDVGDDKLVSHNFEVKPGEVWVITAQGMMDGDVIAVETVTGCGLGDMFECYMSPACGCPVTLNCGTPRVVIPFTGRYRLNITTGAPGEYRVTAYPTASAGFTEGNMACGCGNSAAATVDAIIASPSALAGLCSGLGPCIDSRVGPAVAAAVEAAITDAVPSAAHDNPTAFVLLQDAFGTNLGYAFPL